MNGDGDENNANRTVFRPSPLQGRPRPEAPEPAPFGAPPAAPFGQAPAPDTPPPPTASAASPPLVDDDIPRPPGEPKVRNRIMAEAAPILSFMASVRSGRARIALPDLHARMTAAVSAFDRAVVAAAYPDEQRQRALYAVCATVDDIAQNLPGQAQDAAEWARRSLVVQFFKENIGGDRFWQIVDNMLARPAQYADLIELFHACLAAGFEGRFRVMPDGKRRLQEVTGQLYASMEHVRRLSATELSPHWRGQPTPMRRVGFWSILALAGAAAFGLLAVIYIVLRLILLQTGHPAMTALKAINPDQPLRLSRLAPPPPPATSGQLQTIQGFLAPEIAQHLVVVDQDGSSIRVRTTVGQLFASGSDQLDSARRPLIDRIGAAVETQRGTVRVEGYTDSDRVSSLTFPDNNALSLARAQAVAGMIKAKLSDASRVSAEGFGDSRPIASNDTPQGKALNRRVEIVIPRT
ncbi:type IVB secretion system protein IcmH/DotU [Caulobacter sp. KR2-114]|uniref:type IVB secretion system protein IcmH/DotU n=1 Tax=Caulobacter sp. KR2-114 TaxID=3400912 RepID=UPI003C0A8EA1